MSAGNIDSGLYWTLPGPRRFITRIAQRAEHERTIEVNLPFVIMPGTWDAVEQGLNDAHFRSVRQIVVRGGSDIAADIGLLMECPPLTGAQLARKVAPTLTAFILRGEDQLGRDSCRQYFDDFAHAGNNGNVSLVTSLHDTAVASDPDSAVASFDGGLSSDEMEAYVSLRMIGRPGPGSTRLVRQLITEFAGFDAVFAESLMDLPDAKILALRDLLPSLADSERDRWRDGGWLERAVSKVSSEPHALADCYQGQHGNDRSKAAALERIDRRYWRACVKSITPWLEERKSQVLAPLMPLLSAMAAANNGKISVPRGAGSRDVDPDEIEYNNISGMAYDRDPKRPPQLVPVTPAQQAAVKVCHSARWVRNEIAHLRPPKTSDITDLVISMESLAWLCI